MLMPMMQHHRWAQYLVVTRRVIALWTESSLALILAAPAMATISTTLDELLPVARPSTCLRTLLWPKNYQSKIYNLIKIRIKDNAL